MKQNKNIPMENNANINIKDVGTLERHIFICQCHSLEHQIAFWYNDDDNEITAEIHLNTNRNFFERLWTGIKYGFGYRSRFGNWDEFIFKNEDLPKLKEFLNKTNKTKKG